MKNTILNFLDFNTEEEMQVSEILECKILNEIMKKKINSLMMSSS
jgi:hypothetical protein